LPEKLQLPFYYRWKYVTGRKESDHIKYITATTTFLKNVLIFFHNFISRCKFLSICQKTVLNNSKIFSILFPNIYRYHNKMIKFRVIHTSWATGISLVFLVFYPLPTKLTTLLTSDHKMLMRLAMCLPLKGGTFLGLQYFKPCSLRHVRTVSAIANMPSICFSSIAALNGSFLLSRTSLLSFLIFRTMGNLNTFFVQN